MRQYLYPFLCVVLLFWLIQWNTSPKPGTTGSQFDNKDFILDQQQPVLVLPKPNLEEPRIADDHRKTAPEENERNKPVAMSEKVLSEKKFQSGEGEVEEQRKPRKKGNVISLTVYMEAQCPDTTGFIKRQLLPSLDKLRSTKRIDVNLIPFGKASCERKDDDFECTCQHGKDECELNALMNCVIDRIHSPEQHIHIIGCIQGMNNIQNAFHTCISGHSQADWLWTCANGRRGRYLHAISGQKTAKIGGDFNFVPWVVINGQRVNDAFYALLENLCDRLVPKPLQCNNFA
ncbi:gamma interferon inducible lysosomal thiol reductase (GILT) domain-containing protein [Ditylenchus destructor]|nr:gamma interferon inducible lysosomal thiol reductase (GILT) domain-containing protein [Ditylenchus destructor]